MKTRCLHRVFTFHFPFRDVAHFSFSFSGRGARVSLVLLIKKRFGDTLAASLPTAAPLKGPTAASECYRQFFSGPRAPPSNFSRRWRPVKFRGALGPLLSPPVYSTLVVDRVRFPAPRSSAFSAATYTRTPAGAEGATTRSVLHDVCIRLANWHEIIS